jgi:hypothetical protein
VAKHLDIDGIRAEIRSLCDLWDSEPAGTLEFRRDLGYQRAILIHTHAHHAVRMARALSVLDEVCTGIELMPTARAVQESAITAAWLLLTDGAEKTMLKEGARQRRAALDELAKFDPQTGAAHAQALETLEQLEQWRESFNFAERCKTLQHGEAQYVTYRLLSAETHAGVSVADFYVAEHQRSAIGLAFNPDAVQTIREAILGISATMLLLAVNADEQARAKPRRTAQIANAAKRLEVGVEILRKDGSGLPPRPPL